MVALTNAMDCQAGGGALQTAMTPLAGLFAALLQQSADVPVLPQMELAETSDGANSGSDSKVQDEGSALPDKKEEESNLPEVQALILATVQLPVPLAEKPAVIGNEAESNSAAISQGIEALAELKDGGLHGNNLPSDLTARVADLVAGSETSADAINLPPFAKLAADEKLSAAVGTPSADWREQRNQVDSPVPLQLENAVTAATDRTEDFQPPQPEQVPPSLPQTASVEPQTTQASSLQPEPAATSAPAALKPKASTASVLRSEERNRPAVPATPQFHSAERMRPFVVFEPAAIPNAAVNSPASNRVSEAQLQPVGEVGETRVVSPVAFHADRVAERLAGTELSFTVRVEDRAHVQVVTNLHERTLALGMVAERAETVAALKSEVPYLETHLRSHSLELGSLKVSLQEAASSNAGWSSGDQRNRQDCRMNPSPVRTEREARHDTRRGDEVVAAALRANGAMSWLA